MQVEQLVRQYLDKIKIMQLATSVNDQPWACTVHFYADKDFNIYWVSSTERRHSQDLTQNPKAAATVMAHENTPDENYVVGITAEGTVELISTGVPDEVVQGYMLKQGEDSNMDDIVNGNNLHKFYRLKPSWIVLFDNKHFPDNPRQEWQLNS